MNIGSHSRHTQCRCSTDESFLPERLKLYRTIYKYDLAYIGTVGPRKRKHKIMHYLLFVANDKTDQELERSEKIKGAIGINIPSKTPEEISLSVLAELVGAFAFNRSTHIDKELIFPKYSYKKQIPWHPN